jgi:hypothetical protein
VYDRTDMRHPTRVVTEGRGRKGQVRLNATGEGTLVLPLSGADWPHVTCDQVVRFELEGEPVWSFIVGKSVNQQVRDTAHDQTVTYTGPGLLGDLAQAVVLPGNGLDAQPVETDRLFSWQAPAYRDGTWRAATEITTVAASVGVWPLMFGGSGSANSFPDRAAPILGPSTGTTDTAPVGTCYFRGEVTVASNAKYIIYVAADNVVHFYIDGVHFAANADLRFTTAVTVDLTAGTHTFAAEVFSGAQLAPVPPTAHNPLGFSCAWYTTDANGNAATLLGHADSTWRILEYPAVVPGMTPGEAIRHVVAENQALGMIPGWVLAFDDESDSNGTPWPIAPDLSTRVGYSLETFIVDELTATYIDVRASIGGTVLYAYVQDQLGSVRSFSLTPPADPADPLSGNLQELTLERTPIVANWLLVQDQTGWHAANATPPGAVRKAATLGLGTTRSASERERIAQGQLGRYSHQRDAVTAKYRPTSTAELPHRVAWVGDTISIPGWDGTPVSERILSWTFDEDDNGKVTWTPEVGDLVKAADERALAAITKMANGTISGDSLPAQPISVPSGGPAHPDVGSAGSNVAGRWTTAAAVPVTSGAGYIAEFDSEPVNIPAGFFHLAPSIYSFVSYGGQLHFDIPGVYTVSVFADWYDVNALLGQKELSWSRFDSIHGGFEDGPKISHDENLIAGFMTQSQGSWVIAVNAGDYLKVEATQNSGLACTITPTLCIWGYIPGGTPVVASGSGPT